MNSKLYVGQVRHRRRLPHEHVFSYNMFMMYLDLDELPDLFDRFLLWSARRFNIAWYNRKHHLGSSDQPLKQSVQQLVFEKTGIELKGPVRLLTHLSYFGYGFNPVSFYYCFDESDDEIKVIIAEVNNTPWGEQFCYVFPESDNLGNNQKQKFELEKAFHVSPFNPMDQNYKWYLSSPGRHLSVHIENWRDNERVFDATLSLKAKEISSASLATALMSFPLMTLKVSVAIYYQALKLLIKRTPLFTHPDKVTSQLSKNK